MIEEKSSYIVGYFDGENTVVEAYNSGKLLYRHTKNIDSYKPGSTIKIAHIGSIAILTIDPPTNEESSL